MPGEKWSEQCADRKREFECGGSLSAHGAQSPATPREGRSEDILLECAWLCASCEIR